MNKVVISYINYSNYIKEEKNIFIIYINRNILSLFFNFFLKYNI